MIFALVFFVLLAVGGLAAFLVLQNRQKSKGKGFLQSIYKNGIKDEGLILEAAQKRLEKNPHDAEALLAAGDVYYKNKNWEKTYKTYETLCGMPNAGKNAVNYETHFRMGEAARELELLNEAFRSFVGASSFAPNDYKAQYELGNIEFKRGNYEKAVNFLTKARNLNAENAPVLCLLGLANFKLKQYKEAMVNIRKALEIAPGDKESLFTLAVCYTESGQSEQALRIYSHLRADPRWGPEACLASGGIHLLSNRYDEAITDFEIGLRHTGIKPAVEIELHYQSAKALLKKTELGKALLHLNKVHSENPSYKDVQALIAQNAELNANNNLKTYVMSQQAEFLGLCRKIVMNFYPKARVKIVQASMEGNDWADILAEINTPKWADIVGFRFIRSEGAVGELILRDFHAHLKDVKAGKGICCGIGQFSDEAKRFTEARLIDLIEKTRFVSILANLDIPRPAEISPVLTA